MNPALDAALTAGGGVASRRAHPALASAFTRAARAGTLVRMFPGVYARPDATLTLAGRARALRLADPDAVVTGVSAGRLMGWFELPATTEVTAASGLASRPGFVLERRRVPRRLTRKLDGLVLTSRALTTLDLLPSEGAGALDHALRRGVGLDALWAAYHLTPGRPGNGLRRRLLEESRTEPWSPLERSAHAQLHASGVTGWKANRRVFDRHGELIAVCDIAFEPLWLDIELDGRGHLEPEQWRHDQARDLALACQGWQVVRFARGAVDAGTFAASVRAVVAARESRLGRRAVAASVPH